MSKKHGLKPKILKEAGTYAVQPDIAFLPVEKVLERLNTGLAGLSQEEASKRLSRHGRNSISVDVPVPVLSLLKENFLHTMAILLWAAGAVGFAAKMPELGIAIWLVNVVNGTFSFWQEYRAESATEALKKLLPQTVQVIRSGQTSTLAAEELVPGDIILVSEGDKVSADARLLESESLGLDQSTLTGESRQLRKIAHVVERNNHKGDLSSHRADLPNLIFAGTTVLSGHGKAVVYATGTSTEFGRIAHLTQTIADQSSPLQREMMRVTRIVTALAVSIGVVMFLVAVVFGHNRPEEAFIFAMGMVVAFVPEGMVPTVTLSLAMAVQRMVKRQALVKRLSSVEALGCTNVICTDKTGTLTENQMTVTKAFVSNSNYSFSGLGYAVNGVATGDKIHEGKIPETLLELFRSAVLCNNASFELRSLESKHSGDPTELALLVAAGKLGLSRLDEECRYPRIHEIAFDSIRKCMSTVHATPSSRLAYVKGSPTAVLEHCKKEFLDGNESILDETRRTAISEQINDYARQGLRVIAGARKELADDAEFSPANVERDLTFLGLFAMLDPPRPEVPEAVQKCHAAGIQVVMITGDYEVTAEAIARKVGILATDNPRVITGAQLDRMSDQELVELLSHDIIFARVNPEHKLRVVQAFQRSGKIVAVTGDGVNDAPALKRADIGVAMGLAGNDVAREAADIILLDDNFASIVNAVEEGRAVYDNIKKFAVYVFNSNMAEAVPFAVMLLSCGLVPMPLTVMQVLSIDLGTDMVPAMGLGVDPAEDGVMRRPPRSLSEPLLSYKLLTKALLWYGGIESIAGMSGYFYLNYLHGWPQAELAALGTDTWKAATTMTLACIVAGQIGAVFCCRIQEESLFRFNPFGNKLIIAGVLVELFLLCLLIYNPTLQKVFNTAPLELLQLAFAFIWIPVLVILDEIRKFILRTQRGRS